MPDILRYGDSNNYGTLPMPHLGHDQRFDHHTRRPCVLGASLDAGWHVIDEGHAGRTTLPDNPIEGAQKNGCTALPAILESHAPLNLMMLVLETNDHKQRFDLTTPDIALGAGKLAEIARASGAVNHVLLVCPPPVSERGCLAEMFGEAEVRSAGPVDHMQQMAKHRGVHFLNAADHIESNALTGVHFSADMH